MADVVGSFYMSHGGWCYRPLDEWAARSAQRSHRKDTPVDDYETNRLKKDRIKAGFATLQQKVREANLDALVVFGDDQLEVFDFNNFPSFAIFVDEEFEGSLSSVLPGGDEPQTAGFAVNGGRRARVKNDSSLAVTMLTGLIQQGFDPAFLMGVSNPDRGMGHAFMRPAESLAELKIPVIPVLMNLYYAPQMTATRCYQLGRAIRKIFDDLPRDLRVGVVGSGGLWHTPGAPDSYLNEDFDVMLLSRLAAGDAAGMAEHFDSYQVPPGDVSQDLSRPGPGTTGMPGSPGPQGGSRETCAWIAAAAVVEGNEHTVVDYIPLYASPLGVAFAYWCKDDSTNK